MSVYFSCSHIFFLLIVSFTTYSDYIMCECLCLSFFLLIVKYKKNSRITFWLLPEILTWSIDCSRNELLIWHQQLFHYSIRWKKVSERKIMTIAIFSIINEKLFLISLSVLKDLEKSIMKTSDGKNILFGNFYGCSWSSNNR